MCMDWGKLPSNSSHLLCKTHMWDDGPERKVCVQQWWNPAALLGRLEKSKKWKNVFSVYFFLGQMFKETNKRIWVKVSWKGTWTWIFLQLHEVTETSCFLLKGECDLVSLLQVMVAVFGEFPPVAMRPYPEQGQAACKGKKKHGHILKATYLT